MFNVLSRLLQTGIILVTTLVNPANAAQSAVSQLISTCPEKFYLSVQGAPNEPSTLIYKDQRGSERTVLSRSTQSGRVTYVLSRADVVNGVLTPTRVVWKSQSVNLQEMSETIINAHRNHGRCIGATIQKPLVARKK